MIRFGLIGCGLIGRKRALAMPASGKVCLLSDKNNVIAEALASDLPDAKVVEDWRDICSSTDIDAVIVSVSHDSLASISIAAIRNGKHLLVEKPAARTANEFRQVVKEAEQKGVVLKVGYNHRYHPSLLKAKEIIQNNILGPLMFVRGRYGHGGRVGYENEWRAQKEISGGGELIDQGSHLIDLSMWILGDFNKVHGVTPTFFWDMEVEDNCFLSLTTKTGQMAWLHASWSEWKNMFCFEIYGREGKIQIDGLGGSYGRESLILYQMSAEMGPPATVNYEFPESDNSWRLELVDFIGSIGGKNTLQSDGNSALRVLEIIESIYKENQNDNC